LRQASHPSENPFHLEDPLSVEGTGVQPNLSGVFSKSSDKEMLIFFVAHTPDASAQIHCTFEFLRDGKPDPTLERATAVSTRGERGGT